ncbi:MAG: DUF1778 domain-containing protein [Acidobacteriota bacterium]
MAGFSNIGFKGNRITSEIRKANVFLFGYRGAVNPCYRAEQAHESLEDPACRVAWLFHHFDNRLLIETHEVTKSRGSRKARLEARLTEEQKDLLSRVAALLARSISDFVVSQDARRDVAVPFVLVDEHSPKTILGYYTLSAFSVDLGDLPADMIRRLPSYPVVRATLLGRLAVNQRHQGRGIGEFLLMDALQRVHTQSSQNRCRRRHR